MEGSLLKKTGGGQWHSRQFKLEGTTLTWLKSDGKTYISVDVSRNSEVRDVKFGTKKFAFDIILPGDQISLSASGEAEKAAWMAALKAAMGKRDEAEGILQKSGAGRMSVRSPAKPINIPKSPAAPATPVAASPASPAAQPSPAAAATAPTPASPAGKTEIASVVAGGLSTQAANAKLQAKLGGKIGTTTQVKCVVCEQTVYKPEELIVDKAVMHKRCFQCAHCKRQLTMGNFACINSVFYCKVHYFELFSTNGGKYDKAFGDAGFKTKATTSYTPGEILQPGKIGKLPAVSPVKTAAPAAASPAAAAPPASVSAPVVASPASVPASPVQPEVSKHVPKKLEIKAPVSSKVVEKKEVEVIPKKNMDDLRKMVVLPGMQPPKPKKEEPVVVEAEKAEPVATEPSADENKETATPEASPEVTSPVEAAQPEVTESSVDEPSHVVEETPAIQIVRPPAGVNFALEAMKVRQAQMAKQGIAAPVQEDASEARSSVRMSGRLDHSAVLSKPKMAGRRAPKVQQVGQLLPKAEIDRMSHEQTFRILIDGPNSSDVLVVHATSQFEKDHWVATVSANVYMLGLKHELEMAQKRDMMSALQAQINLETFLGDNKVIYTGFLEKCSMKSQRNWKKRWFELNDKGQLMYFENENSKKPKQTLQLTYLTVITSADGSRLDAPLVISTKATEMSAESGGSLPLNIAIFDNEDVTIDLNTIVPDAFPGAESTVAEISVQEQQVATGQTMGEVAIPTDEPEAKAAVETEPQTKSETIEKTEEPVTEATDKAEPTAEVPSSTPDDSAPKSPKPESKHVEDETSQRINDAWSTPGKAPDRIRPGTDQPLREDSAPLASPTMSRRKSGRKKDCTIM